MTKNVSIQYLPDTDSNFPVPEYQTAGSSGLDIRAYLPSADRTNGISLLPLRRALISSGFRVEIPDGYEGQIRARSGLALKFGVTLANGVGTIDSDYRGGLSVILLNLGSAPFIVKHGQRIAQLVIAKYSRVQINIVEDMSETDRNESGYGSTGNF